MASTEEHAKRLQENIGNASFKQKQISDEPQNRKRLQTLQYSALGDNMLTGKDKSISKPKSTDINKGFFKKLIPKKEPVSVYVDPPKPADKEFDNKAVQTEKQRRVSGTEDIDEEAYDLMINEELSENYWKEIAEQRRIALNDSLHENELLHKEVDDLKEENGKLSKLASQADYFAGVLEECLGVKPNNDEEEESQSSEESVSSEHDGENEEKQENSEKEGQNCDNSESEEGSTDSTSPDITENDKSEADESTDDTKEDNPSTQC